MRSGTAKTDGQAPQVSVIIPTFDRAGLVGRAVRSVLAQTFEDWELIVVDDASHDDTAAVMSAFADRRITFVRRDRNGGVAAALNTGIRHARGEFVAFLHSDDEFVPGKLQRQLEVLAEEPETVAAAESFFRIERLFRTQPRRRRRIQDQDLLAFRSNVHLSTLVVRRAVAEAVGFDERLRGTEDKDFCLRLLRRSPIVLVPEVLSLVHRKDPTVRLGTINDKGAIYRYLLDKHADDIQRRRSVHALWRFRIARGQLLAGDPASARRELRSSLVLWPFAPARWLLLLAARGSDGFFFEAFRLYGVFERASRVSRREARLLLELAASGTSQRSSS